MVAEAPKRRAVGRPRLPLRERKMRANFQFYPDELDVVQAVAERRGTDGSEAMNRAWYEFCVTHYPDLASDRAKREVETGSKEPARPPERTGDPPRAAGPEEPHDGEELPEATLAG